MNTILVVDDDPHIRKLIKLYLENSQFSVVEAKDGQEALNYVTHSQNLINNAIKYSDEDGRIEVIMEVDNQAVRVHIKNTGKAIPEKDLPYIFDRFYMVDKARSHSGGGNGLGLSIVKKIVELHSSRINVKSNEGEGTCFTVSIPL
ncbi:ATP-binding protein [Desulfosporosinus sp. BICA1-9]|uniref:ATP-binding response regulator n=1 Tax=Desulfosporosinus sp. BICA1-9 TaxID=1531958 RepID=UPI00054B5670|nr:ATP-binding protein [Desulfosporosinus sp. BICA1-9]KJS89137.1 MAG: hypothetical protein JL57_08975 [Desulfosporosinus sp. BICA1-9]HBW35564.1 GHKL domain-containing protein [Desulfosporosinus sp.]